jgi:hypothetical protein
MKIFFDTEFIDDHNGLHLLSIGLVREDGAAYYAELAETDRSLCNDWVKLHVIPQMKGPILPRYKIADEIERFAGEKPEFWAYFSAHDWVLLNSIYHGMMNLPKSWPHFCNDIRVFRDFDSQWPIQKTPEHHALNDALWVKEVYESIVRK